MTTTEVFVPIKRFTDAKQRLLIQPSQRVELMKRMASVVLHCSPNLETWVVCDDDDVAEWATNMGLSVLFQPASGLNETVRLATKSRQDAGVSRAIVAHGDLPLLSSLERFVDVEGVAIVPDLAQAGTKVLSVPTGAGFKFMYGPNSASAHEAEARRCELEFERVIDPRMGFDINTVEDLNQLSQNHPTTFRRLTANLGISRPQPTQGPSA